MRILYLYQYFKTRDGHGSTRSYEFVRRLLREGHEVRVVTSTALLTLDGRRRWGVIEGSIDGMEVWAVPSSYSNRMGFVRRILEFLRFALLSSLAVLRVERPDLIFASSTPLTVAVPALLGRVVRGIPMVFEVRDLWPEVPVAMGILRNPVLAGLSGWLARAAYRRSARIVALSPGMRDGVVRTGVPVERIAVIPNGSDLDLFRPGISGERARASLDVRPDAFLIIHPGAMGLVNGLEFLIPVCERLRVILPHGVVFLIGDGSQRPGLEERARNAGLDNLRFRDPVPKRDLPPFLAAADLGLMLIRRIPILEMNSANKFFDYAAAGLPCLMNYGGWKADLLRRYDAGIALETDDPDLFGRTIAGLAAHPERLRAMSLRARRMAEENFDREKQYEELRACLVAAAGSD